MSVRLKSTRLINKSGNEVSASRELNSKVVFLYFSAHWCPPCRQFTPMLKEFYSKMKGNGHKIEIVFVSNDKNEEEMMSYFQNDHGDYLAIKFGESDLSNLSQEYDIKGIPTLCVIDKDGKALAPNRQVRELVIQSAQGTDVSKTQKQWQQECGDWTATKGTKLSAGAASSSKQMTREEMRAARLAALEKRSPNASKRAASTAKPKAKAPPVHVETVKSPPAKAAAPRAQRVEAPAPTARAPTASTAPEGALEQLIGMGFPRAQAAQTLDACGGNVENALAILLS